MATESEVKRSVKGKILTGILVLEILLTVVFAGILIYTFQRNFELSSLKTVMNIEGIYSGILENDAKMLSASIDVFMRNDSFKQIYTQRNRDKLFSAGQELFLNDRSRYGITHFYYIDNDGTCFLRMHKPSLHGDAIKRRTFVDSRNSGLPASGIELGKTAFALRVVIPYVYKARRIGYVEFGEEIDHVDRIVKAKTGSDILVLVNKRLLDEKEYHLTRATTNQNDDWNDLRNYALVSETFGDRKFFASHVYDENEITSLKKTSFLGTVMRGGRVLMKGAFPLFDASRNIVATVVVLTDVTDQATNQRLALVFLVAAALVLLAITFWFTSRYLKFVILDPLMDLSNQAVEVSMGKVDKKMETDRTDEIGVLIRAFDRMRASLQMSLTMLGKGGPPK